MIERIEVSAIKYPWGEIVTGFRHSDVIKAMALKRIRSGSDCVQGFVGSSGTFYPRDMAMKVAVMAGQVKKAKEADLYSEDLWPHNPMIEPFA